MIILSHDLRSNWKFDLETKLIGKVHLGSLLFEFFCDLI